jgi:hypothetical protein
MYLALDWWHGGVESLWMTYYCRDCLCLYGVHVALLAFKPATDLLFLTLQRVKTMKRAALWLATAQCSWPNDWVGEPKFNLNVAWTM